MKRTIVIFSLAFLILFSANTFAQKPVKLGHIDFAALYQLMPGMDSAQKKYQEYGQSLKAQMDAMQGEYESKMSDYQASSATLSDLIKKTKEKEIVDLQERIQAFQQSAQESLQKKEQELTEPIINKARLAVKEVGKENGFTYIFNSAETLGNLIYFDGGEDVLPLVKKKLVLK
ncbi:MAG: OmpH family outer membrane protein [Bacteroidota bacterium]